MYVIRLFGFIFSDCYRCEARRVQRIGIMVDYSEKKITYIKFVKKCIFCGTVTDMKDNEED